MGAVAAPHSHVNWSAVLPSAIAVVALVVSVAAVVLPYLRRPKLSLREDESREHSRVEGNGIPHLRALVENARGKRSAKHARVVLDGYRPVGGTGWTRLGSPFLAWPSIFGQMSDAYVDVIFAGNSRPVGIGQLWQVPSGAQAPARPPIRLYGGAQGGTATPNLYIEAPTSRSLAPNRVWKLKLELPENMTLTDGRDWLEPGAWTLRLIVGADDGDARVYELDVAWEADHADADAALKYLLEHLAVRRTS